MTAGELWRRLRLFLQRDRFNAELEEEMRTHLELLAESLGGQEGVGVKEASLAARRQFGNPTFLKEASRDTWGTRWAEDLFRDIGFAARQLRKAPWFAAVAICSIALGIGANTAIFSLIDTILLRMVPVRDPRTLMALATKNGDKVFTEFGYKTYQAIRSRTTFSDVALYHPLNLNVSIDGSLEPTVSGQMVSGNYFSVVGVNPAAGRAIGLGDDRIPDGDPVAMISYAYWKRRFGIAPSTVGRTISISGKPFTIIGVTPPEFFGVEVGTAPDVFVPLTMQPTVMPATPEFEGRPHGPFLLARVKPGRDPRQATAELDSIYVQEIPRYRPELQPDWSKLTPELKKRLQVAADPHISLVPVGALSDLRGQYSQPLFILMMAVGVLLLIACANTANLLLARAAARKPEITMRLALGASRSRLIFQLLIESLVLAVLGGACGILLASWATKLLVVYMSAGRNPIVIDLNPDLRVLSFTAAVSMLTGILFGLAPALRATRVDLAPSLKGAGTLVSARGRFGPGRALAVTQVALSLLLLFGAGLFTRSLQNLSGDTRSTSGDNVLTLRVLDPFRGREAGPRKELDVIYRDLIRRVEEIPGVRVASMAEMAPTLSGPGNMAQLPNGLYSEAIGVFEIYPNYFAAAGIPLLAGRDLANSDLDANSPTVCVVNETLVRRFYPGEDPLGKDCGENGRIVGVVHDLRLMNPGGVIQPMIYRAFLHSHTGRSPLFLYVRTAGTPIAILPRIREEVRATDPAVPRSEAHTLAQEMDAALVRERMIATLSGLFSVLALLLTCIGLYGLLAFAVVQRAGEVGIRMALGATHGSVLWMVLREALLLAMAGIAIGVPAALAAGRVVSRRIPDLLFGLKATDPVTLVSAASLLLVVAGVAAYIPARRASHVDPMVALRNE